MAIKLISLMIAYVALALLCSCASSHACYVDRLAFQCTIPENLPRVIAVTSKHGGIQSVDAYSAYLNHYMAGWAECLDRFMLGPDYLNVYDDAPLAFGTSEIFIGARQAGFNLALQQIRCLVTSHGYEHTKSIVARYQLPSSISGFNNSGIE